MISKHVSEEEIQLYVLDSKQVPPPVKEHLELCADCQARVREYELLFTSIQSLDKPSFDFDVAALVLPQLPEPEKAPSYKLAGFILITLAIAALVSLPFLLFDYKIANLWNNISPWLIGLVAIVAIAFIGINIWDMYRRYRQQLQKLSFE